MKKLLSILAISAVAISCLFVPLQGSAQDILAKNVTVAGDKTIANGLTIGTQKETIDADFTLKTVGSKINEGVGFYYQNGDGSPHWSFYRITFYRDTAGSGRTDFYCEKQYNDSWAGFIWCKVNSETTEKDRYVSADYDWDTAAETGFHLRVVIDPTANTAVATLTGATSGKSAIIHIDLSEAATNESTAGQWQNGSVFLRTEFANWSNFAVADADGTLHRFTAGYVTVDGDKTNANGIVIGEQKTTIKARYTLKTVGSKLNEGVGFYYQNGDGNPHWSFYRITFYRDTAGSGRTDFYCEKQYNDSWVGFIWCKVNNEITEKDRFVSVDYSWDTSAETALDLTVVVDPTANTAVATLTGVTSGNSATIHVDLSEAATNEATAGQWQNGGVFLRTEFTDWSKFSIAGFNGDVVPSSEAAASSSEPTNNGASSAVSDSSSKTSSGTGSSPSTGSTDVILPVVLLGALSAATALILGKKKR